MLKIAADLHCLARAHHGRLLIRSMGERLVLCVVLARFVYALDPVVQCTIYDSYVLGDASLVRYLARRNWLSFPEEPPGPVTAIDPSR